MKSVLLVEDEKFSRQGMRYMIQRSGVPVDVILECGNGEEALELLRYQKVDVMFTDIRMPRMDGIELVKEVEKLPDAPLMVAVSGYDDFAYAVEMLRSGVREYLLKPVDRDKVCQVMRMLQEELEYKNRSEERNRLAGRQQIRHLLEGTVISEQERELLQQKLTPYFFQNPYVVCCVPDAGDVTESDLITVVDRIEDESVCIVEQENVGPFIRNEFPDSSIGISSSHQGIDELREAYLEAFEARKRAFCIGKAVNYGEEKRKVPEGLKKQAAELLVEQIAQQRIQLAGSARTEELDRQWGMFFTETIKERISPEEFLAVMQNSVREIAAIYGESMDEKWRSGADTREKILSYENMEQYREEVMEWIMELHRRKNRQEETKSADHRMQTAIEYIRENYNKDLNMAVVSNYLSMNYSLFSYSFKQYTGTSFVNYLKDIRIQEAKKLLSGTDLKIQDISVRVGYENEKHFMKTFRMQCGVSPTEYRKNMKGASGAEK